MQTWILQEHCVTQKTTRCRHDKRSPYLGYMQNCSVFQACLWWDNKPVNFLCTGGSITMERVARREKDGSQHEVPCPKFVKDYQRLMGGVDIHDQLRLQRYSLQLAARCQKYYASLFWGLVDMAIVNSYIVYKELHKRRNAKPKLSHAQFKKVLHLQLLGLTVQTSRPPPWSQLRLRSHPKRDPRLSTRLCK